MTETILNVNPTSYRFTSLEEATSINIETNAPSVSFVRVNDLGKGSAVFDPEGNILTSKSYGKGSYKFVAQADGGDEKSVYFDLEVTRPLLGKQKDYKVFVDVSNSMSAWEFTPPEGYRLKLLDFRDLKTPIVEFAYETNKVIIVPTTVGKVVCDVVVEKTEPTDNEKNIEYIVGTLTIDIFSLIIDPKETYLYSKINKTVVVNSIKCILGSDNKGAQLTFDAIPSEEGIMEFTHTELHNETDGYSYSFEIKTKKKGEAKINIEHQGQIIGEFTVDIQDIKELRYSPGITEITLPYDTVHTISGIYYDNNDVSEAIEVNTDDGTLVELELIRVTKDGDPIEENKDPSEKSLENAPMLLSDTGQVDPTDPELDANGQNGSTENPDGNTDTGDTEPEDKGPFYYKLTVKNIARKGGNATFKLRAINTDEGSVTFKVKCFKEVIPGDVTLEPSSTNVTLHEGTSYDFTYISITNCDRIEVESTDVSIAEVRIEELTSAPTRPDGGENVPIEFPPDSVQKQMFIIGKLPGKCDISVKGIVNDNDVSAVQIIKATVLPSDELPDFARMVNLETDKITRSRQGDIVINFPDDSSVLVLKEKLQQNLVIEFGYSFDYIDKGNPTKTTNPVTYSKNTGSAIWLNSVTNEIFTCIDNTPDNNKWKGSNGTTINYIEYPNPGEKGFGVGPAPEGLAEKYDLVPLDGCFDRNSDTYGNYRDKSNTIFVFIPKHYIIPKFDSNLIKQYPYDGMSYEFSWVPVEDKFTDIHIPRCFINKGNVQEGIFVSKYNSNRFQQYYKEDSYVVANKNKLTATAGIHSTYPVVITGSSRTKKWHTVINDSKLFPELYYMAKTLIPEGTNKNDLGRHNMSIFIQTMLINLGDLHTIASYEKSVKEDVCGKLKYLVSGTWVRELTNVNTAGTEKQKYNPVKRIFTGDTTINNETIHFDSGSGSIKFEYNRLFSHNGQYCGAYDVGGPINTPLPGILVVQDDMSASNNYKVYALKKELDIAEIEKRTFDAVKDTNTISIVERSELFNLNNYELLVEIVNNEEVCKLLYMDNYNAYNTHLSDVTLLEGTIEQYNSINAGLNLGSLTAFTSGNYTEQYSPVVDRAMRTSKFKNSVYNMGFLSKKENMRADRTKWFGMFTANYVPNVEEATVGGFNIDGVYNGYRSRVLRHIGSLKYFKQNSSEYMFGMRTCITPDASHVNTDK